MKDEISNTMAAKKATTADENPAAVKKRGRKPAPAAATVVVALKKTKNDEHIDGPDEVMPPAADDVMVPVVVNNKTETKTRRGGRNKTETATTNQPADDESQLAEVKGRRPTKRAAKVRLSINEVDTDNEEINPIVEEAGKNGRTKRNAKPTSETKKPATAAANKKAASTTATKKAKTTTSKEDKDEEVVVKKPAASKRGRKAAAAIAPVDENKEEEREEEPGNETEVVKVSVTVTNSKRPVRKRRNHLATPLSDDDDDDHDYDNNDHAIAVPKKQRQPAAATKKNAKNGDSGNDSSDDFVPTPPAEEEEKKTASKKRAVNKRNAAKKPTPSPPPPVDDDESDEDDADYAAAPAKSKSKPVKVAKKGGDGAKNRTTTDYTDMTFACTNKNKRGEAPNLTIASWNLGGLKGAIKKDFLNYIRNENADIICLQETKVSNKTVPDEMDALTEYKSYWVGSAKEGYAGVGILTKPLPVSITYGINDSEMDDEGRCITLEFENFYLVNVYVVNAGRKLVSLERRLRWNKCFKDYVTALDKKMPVIVCGDMNVAHNEIDLANPKTNKRNAGFTQEEREGMTDFLSAGFVDTFRMLYPKREAAYTFWTYMKQARTKNIGWRLDYFITSERLSDAICDTVIRSDVYGSDHCPIILFIKI